MSHVSVKTIMTMLSRSNPHLITDVYDIIEWSAEAIRNIGHFEAMQRYLPSHKGNVILVENKRVLLPCNIYRLLGVYKNMCPITSREFIRNGDYLDFDRIDNEYIQLDYIGIKVDEDGYPMIAKSQLQACYWYCLKMLYLEDFLNGKMDGNRYDYLEQQYGKYVARSRSSFEDMTRNDIDEIRMIMANMIPKLRMPKGL